MLAFVAMAAWWTPSALADRAFTSRFSTNDTGDIAIASNTLMTCPAAAARCLDARNLVGDNNALINNSYTMTRVDTDGDAATTLDSSTATLTLPAGSTVLFAGLYWGADRQAGAGGAAAPTPANINLVKLRAPGQAYRTLTATTIDVGTRSNATRYQGFVDVTAIVAAAGGGTYAVGDVQAATGSDRYAGWALVVAYRDTSQPARNLTVIDGYRTILPTDPPTTIPISGFRTPPGGPVRTNLGFITYEGDAGLVGDTASLNGVVLSNAASPASNFFNSSISTYGVHVATRAPNDRNAFGYDADLLRADGVLPNDASSASIAVTTSGDQYLPGVVTFATELFAPAVALSKSVVNVTHPGGLDQRGDVLRYTVTATNTGQDGADEFVLIDAIPAGATYVAGSLRQTAGAGAPATLTDAVGDDRAELDAASGRVAFRLGTGATATRGGRLAVAATATVTFDVRIGDVPPRTRIVNAASAAFVAQSLRTPLGADSPQVVNVVAAADLALAKSHAPELVAGTATTFRLVASNVGNLPTDGSTVTVSDAFPAGVAGFDAITGAGGAGWTCGIAATTVTCWRADVLAAGASYPPILVDAVVHDPPPATVTNVATVAGGGDADPSNNSAVDVGAGTTAADLRIAKAAVPTTGASGGRVIFTLDVENLGPSTAQAVTIADALPAGLADARVTTSRGTCDAAVACALGALAAGETARVTIDALVTANATTLVNVAGVDSPTPDPVPGNDTAQATVDVPNTADLRVAKTASSRNPVAGAVNGLTYTLTVVNDGPGAASVVRLVDDVPALFAPTAIVPPAGWTCATPVPPSSSARAPRRCRRARPRRSGSPARWPRTPARR